MKRAPEVIKQIQQTVKCRFTTERVKNRIVLFKAEASSPTTNITRGPLIVISTIVIIPMGLICFGRLLRWWLRAVIVATLGQILHHLTERLVSEVRRTISACTLKTEAEASLI